MCEAPILSPALKARPGSVFLKPQHQEVEAGEPGIQDHPQLHTEF